MKEDGSEWGHRSTCAPHPRANPQPRPCLATPTGRPELPSVSQWLAAWRPRATEAQRSAQRGRKAGGAGHFQCQPFRPIGRTGLVLWGDGLGWACPCPHQEGLGAQPGRDESSLGPSAGAAVPTDLGYGYDCSEPQVVGLLFRLHPIGMTHDRPFQPFLLKRVGRWG